MRKAKDRLGVLYGQIMGFQTDLSECINQSLTVEAFETKWKQMLHTYKLENNRHLKLMFSTASQWIPAYFKDIFLADMSTSQRSESMNAAMRMWFGSHTSIFNFVIQFEKITRGIFDKESEEDLRTTNQIHSLWSDDQLEEQARDVYTRNVFMIFKDNLKRASGYNIEMLENDKLYLVKSQKYRTSYKVCVDRSNMKVECECKGFERVGLFCSHALKVMQSIGMNTLPSHYILKR
ncbi:hypothetical protein LUZ60_015551 [Juncus effusus]|nr:hypothetical protein LUZ60_015551 [Juncus effusus]